MEDINDCDKCGLKMSTYDLIWLTSEDFEPLPKDNFNKLKYLNVIKKYDALCETCYKAECCGKSIN